MRRPPRPVSKTLLRLDPETRELLDEFAARTGRTVSAAATVLLHDGLAVNRNHARSDRTAGADA